MVKLTTTISCHNCTEPITIFPNLIDDPVVFLASEDDGWERIVVKSKAPLSFRIKWWVGFSFLKFGAFILGFGIDKKSFGVE